MKKILFTLIGLFTLGTFMTQDVTTVEAKNQDISDNLDLEAVAVIFGKSQDLEDFEKRLNDPESKISNLDLNQDGYVDYLRVIETTDNDAHLITIQAVLGADLFQDVATIDVEKDGRNNTHVQVIGDVFMYGPNYIIEPVYVDIPVVCLRFWRPRRRLWISPWYYGYYPNYWSRWRPFSYNRYYAHIHTQHIQVHHVFHYASARRSNACLRLQRETRRNDYERQYPTASFASRHTNVDNKYDLDQQRGTKPATKPIKISSAPATGKLVKEDWQTQAEIEGKPSIVKDRKVSVPSEPSTYRNETSKPDASPSREEKPTITAPKEERSKPAYSPSKTERNKPVYTRPNTERSKPSYSPPKKESPRYERSSPKPASQPATREYKRPESRPAPSPARTQRSRPSPSSSEPKATSRSKAPTPRSTPRKSSSSSKKTTKSRGK